MVTLSTVKCFDDKATDLKDQQILASSKGEFKNRIRDMGFSHGVPLQQSLLI